ncbi:MAG: glycosyltransferase family 2 protein [Candidatus Hydrogenedentes bacterium]|nr:glycosyltransferase family 2 protein [Candidatus Hydrogenedentota bacterium]
MIDAAADTSSPPAASVDIVIVSFNTARLLRACLDSICSHAAMPAVRTIVVDNGSRDDSVSMVASAFPEAMVIALGENLGFGAANNVGARAGSGEFLLFLNSDAELTPGALDALRNCLANQPRAVVAGPGLFFPDGSFQPACRRFPTLARNLWGMSGMQARFPGAIPCLDNWLTQAAHRPGRAVDMVSGACFMMRRSYFERIGGFDENLFLYEEELDLLYPARRAGEQVVYCPEAQVLHHRGGSTDPGALSAFSARHMYRSKYYAFRKHYGRLSALAAFLTDAGILGFSVLHNRLRGRKTPATMHLAMCRRGWRESGVPTADLRARADFYDG